MPKPRILAVTLLLVLSVVLAACGNEDSTDPTPEPTATRSPVLPTEMPVITEVTEASPAATGQATPTTTTVLAATPAVATPAMVVPPVEAVTATVATVTEATPAIAAMTPTSTPAEASPVVASPVPEVSTPVAVTVVLNGTEQVDYVVTPEGCVGLGQWRSLKPGAQVVVRDANGTVVDIASLEAGDDGCSWMADITAPGSEFVSISIPMVTEVWFTQADIEAGQVELTLP